MHFLQGYHARRLILRPWWCVSGFLEGPATDIHWTGYYLPNWLQGLLSWLCTLSVTLIIPLFVMFWKPFSIIIRHATKIPYVLYLMTVGVTRLPGCLLYMVLQWSRFLTLQLALRVLPTGVILAIFWLIAPLHTNYWETVRRKNVPKCSINNFPCTETLWS